MITVKTMMIRKTLSLVLKICVIRVKIPGRINKHMKIAINPMTAVLVRMSEFTSSMAVVNL